MGEMELYKLVEHIKKEYDEANDMQKESTNKEYWFGRNAALGELLEIFQEARIKPYKNCRYCEITEKGCRDCFKS